MPNRATPLTNTDNLPHRPKKVLQEVRAATPTAATRDIRAARDNLHAAPTIRTAATAIQAEAAHTAAAVRTDHPATPPAAERPEPAEEDKIGNNENTENILHSNIGTPHCIYRL